MIKVVNLEVLEWLGEYYGVWKDQRVPIETEGLSVEELRELEALLKMEVEFIEEYGKL